MTSKNPISKAANHKVLVANRGEIAARICRGVFEAGWQSVALVEKGAGPGGHAARADEVAGLPGQGAAAYLDVAAVVAAARETGCTMVHPGYGFLSESADLAAACDKEGLIFVGPPSDTLRRFGDKSMARQVAGDCGVPVPSGSGILDGAQALRSFMERLGAPVMLKAVSGGGGRGIRIVRTPDEAEACFARCRSEAETSFGDGRLYAEQLIENARHVEVQIAGDGSGAVAILGDRECSLQRGRQKVVEFAPATGVEPGLKRELFAAARRIGSHVSYLGIGTVEFLVSGDTFHFLEVNPRLQVEHTVTEAVTGVDLVALQFRLALGYPLKDLNLPDPDAARGCAVQLRVNTEVMGADGSARPASGRVGAFEMPMGLGIRVDTVACSGHVVTPDFDPLLAKIIIHQTNGDRAAMLRRAYRALCETRVDGVETNLGFLRGLVTDDAVIADRHDVGFIDRTVSRIMAEQGQHPDFGLRGAASPDEEPADKTDYSVPDGLVAIRAETDARVIAVSVETGTTVAPGETIAMLEAMKMEFPVLAGVGGTVQQLVVKEGDAVRRGEPILLVAPDGAVVAADETEEALDLEHIRADLQGILDARHRLTDAARPEAVEKRRRSGKRTARENIADLCDPGSFHEYGGFALAAQRGRRSEEELAKMSPADGMVMGYGTVNAALCGPERGKCAVLAYDYTVFAGTQGVNAHIKKNRLFRLIENTRVPLVMFAEGGGGRPGDTDDHGFLKLYNPSFYNAARLRAKVPVIAIVSGNCFAGNAALAACADVIIATRDASIGMGGPAMVSGGGLGDVSAADIGPVSMQGPNGVVDMIVADEAEAVAVVKALLSCIQGPVSPGAACDQRMLRHIIPEEPRRAYQMRDVIAALVDEGSFLELRPEYGIGMITGIVRIAGQPFAVMANEPMHLAGALDAAASSKAAEFVPLVEKLGLPLLKLVDTPGFMVGPRAEAEGLVRQAGRMFAAGAILTVPQFTIVVRKAYGLGALAMVFGNSHEQVMTVAWPTGHFGKMGLEGQVRLAYRRELEAIADEAARDAKLREMIEALHEQGHPINAAAYLSIDDVIDPVATRDWLMSGLELSRAAGGPIGKSTERREELTWDR